MEPDNPVPLPSPWLPQGHHPLEGMTSCPGQLKIMYRTVTTSTTERLDLVLIARYPLLTHNKSVSMHNNYQNVFTSAWAQVDPSRVESMITVIIIVTMTAHAYRTLYGCQAQSGDGYIVSTRGL